MENLKEMGLVTRVVGQAAMLIVSKYHRVLHWIFHEHVDMHGLYQAQS